VSAKPLSSAQDMEAGRFVLTALERSNLTRQWGPFSTKRRRKEY
jgi:hypothetical protein